MRKTLENLLCGLLVILILTGCRSTDEILDDLNDKISETNQENKPTVKEAVQEIDLTPVSADAVTYEKLQNYADSLQDYLEQLKERYNDTRIPPSEELEGYFEELEEQLNNVKAIGPDDITEEDCKKLIEELKATETDMDSILNELDVTIEDAATDQTVDAVNHNSNLMIDYYNDLVDYFAQDARLMSDAQRVAMQEARRRIDRYDDIYFDGIAKESELVKLNDEILEDIKLLDDIAKSTRD